tara:strand:+ start:572 stop:811 length:240 start_codon:yes stop_codon:yes gene_type:complete
MEYLTPVGFIQNINGPELIIILLMLTLPVLSLACLIHCGLNQTMNGTEKGIWILVIFLIPVIGSIAYIAFGRKGSEARS